MRKSSFYKPEISIHLRTGSDHTYKTLDRIEGTVSVTTWQDTPFDALSIQFRGTTDTTVQNHPSSTTLGQSQASHTFMKLDYTPKDAYPTPRILQAGQTYVFDFEFCVPQQLSSSACTHPVCDDNVIQSHLQLPPTLGCSEVSSAYPSTYNDLSPVALSVYYDIVARLSGECGAIASASESIRVVPVSEIDPAVYDTEDDDVVTKVEDTKTIRKGPFRRKSGIITMNAKALVTIPYAEALRSGDTAGSTSISFTLRFDPTERGDTPPCISTLRTRLLVTNIFSTSPWESIPDAHNARSDTRHGLDISCIKLSPTRYDKVSWQRRPYATPCPNKTEVHDRHGRHDSLASIFNLGSQTPSSTTGLKSYETHLGNSIQLPSNKILVPSFHSCLVSRIYTLQLFLEVAEVSDLELRVPVQIYNEL